MKQEPISFNFHPLTIEREFAFTAADFERVKALIYQHAGISLTPAKQDMVYTRLARRLRALACTSFAQYLDRLEAGEGGERQAFVNALTTNLTSFFREPHHFEILHERLRKIGRMRPIRIWCNAASTGEEVYSLAITACEAFDTLTPPVRILASDIDTHVLDVAAKGVYSHERVERLSPERQRRFFQHVPGDAKGQFSVRRELRHLVEFKRVNLLDPRYAVDGPFDAIFCRNVMIYFDKPTQRAILARLLPLLRTDGLLFAGHSESFLHAADLFRSMGRTVYAPVIQK